MGGAGLPLLVVAVILFALVVIGMVAGVVPWSVRRAKRIEDIKAGDTTALEYVIPEGHDPAAILGALHRDGFDAIHNEQQGRSSILIPLPEGTGRRRARARAVIEHEAYLNTQGDPAERTVRFEDE
jgi:hypothetical protein